MKNSISDKKITILNKIINGLVIFESLPFIYLLLLVTKIISVNIKAFGIFSIPLVLMVNPPIIPIIVVILSIICKRKLITIMHIIIIAYCVYLYI